MNKAFQPKAIAIVTGAGLKPATVFFKKGNPATLIEHDGKPHKMNAAAGVAAVLNGDYHLCVTGYDEGHLDTLSTNQLHNPHMTRIVNLQDKAATAAFVEEVAVLKRQTGLPVHLIHYGGASDTTTPLPFGSVFGHTWDMPGEAIPHLVANNCTTLLNIAQAMKRCGIFDDQEVSKIVLVSAITALRTKLCHAVDASQKGAGHSLIRSMALDLTPERIYLTEVMPGITDTGFYDNPKTLEFLLSSSAAMGYSYTPDTVPVFGAEVIGEAVAYVLNARAHIREMSLMPYGQYPQLGA